MAHDLMFVFSSTDVKFSFVMYRLFKLYYNTFYSILRDDFLRFFFINNRTQLQNTFDAKNFGYAGLPNMHICVPQEAVNFLPWPNLSVCAKVRQMAQFHKPTKHNRACG